MCVQGGGSWAIKRGGMRSGSIVFRLVNNTMGKLGILSVLVVILAVYASAKYTYNTDDSGEVDNEIDTIARALDGLDNEDKRGDDGAGGDDDDDFDCECTEDCDCDTAECTVLCEAYASRDLETREPQGVEKKFFGIRFRRAGRVISRTARRVADTGRRIVRRVGSGVRRFFRGFGKK